MSRQLTTAGWFDGMAARETVMLILLQQEDCKNGTRMIPKLQTQSGIQLRI